MTLYDTIGRSYREHRRPDPRIAAQVNDALGDARTIVNVGAGTGSYEPADRVVVAVEPSITMIRQRDPGPVIQAAAEALPFPDRTFDAATAFITIHHWADWRAGLREMQRVAPRVVLLGFDMAVHGEYWLVTEYFPRTDPVKWRKAPSVDDVANALGGGVEVITVPTPHDCVDGFYAAYWRRPEAYLDASVRACISNLAAAEPADLAESLARLAADIESGAWHRRHADLLELDTLDTGMRLVIARVSRSRLLAPRYERAQKPRTAQAVARSAWRACLARASAWAARSRRGTTRASSRAVLAARLRCKRNRPRSRWPRRTRAEIRTLFGGLRRSCTMPTGSALAGCNTTRRPPTRRNPWRADAG